MTGILAHLAEVGGDPGRPGGGIPALLRGGVQALGAEGLGPGHLAVGAEAGGDTSHGHRREGVPSPRGNGILGGGGPPHAAVLQTDSAGGKSLKVNLVTHAWGSCALKPKLASVILLQILVCENCCE